MFHLPSIPDVDEDLVRAVSVLAADAATIHAVKNEIGVYTGTVQVLHSLATGADGWGGGTDDEAVFRRSLEVAEHARRRLRRRLTAARLSADPFSVLVDH